MMELFTYETNRSYDIDMLSQLEVLARRSIHQIANILRSSAQKCCCGQHEKQKYHHRKLYFWLLDATKHLDKYNCSIQQRVHWVLNSLEDFPKCIECGKPIDSPKQFKSISKGYSCFCSVKCAKHHGGKTNSIRRRKNNNGSYFSQEEMLKAKQTFIDHYGADNNMKSEKGKEELRYSIQKKYGQHIANVFQLEEKKLKIKQTKLRRHGDENYNNKEKAARTKLDRYGDRHYRNPNQAKQTCIQRYNVDHPMKVQKICQKAVANKKHSAYEIDGHCFDSCPEFCFYVCCRDFNIEVQCHPIDKAIEYLDNNGKKHMYYPDFYIPKIERLVEIKGDHFFKDKDPSKPLAAGVFGIEDGSNKSECKFNAMMDNNVIVLSSKRYRLYEKRVVLKYGRKWINQHKTNGNKAVFNN